MTTQAREYHTQQVHYLRKGVTFDETNIATGVSMGVLPSGAIVVDTIVKMTTAFNAATTNVLVAGTAGNDDEFVDASDVTEGGTAATRATTGLGYIASGDEEVFAKYTQSGTAATAGAAEIVIAYVPDNDG